MPDIEVLLQCERTEAQGFYSLMHHISHETKAALGISTTIIAGGPAWSSRVIDGILFNRVIGLGLFAPCAAEHLNEIDAFYQDRKHAIEASPQAKSLDILDLEERGYAISMRRPKFVRSSEPREIPAGIQVRVATAADADTFAKVMIHSFGLPEAAMAWPKSVVETDLPGRASLMATIDGQPVGAAFLYCANGVGRLGGGCCLPEFRGLGVQKALIEARSSLARDMSATWVTAETNPDAPGAPNLSRHNVLGNGFEHLFDRPQCVKC